MLTRLKLTRGEGQLVEPSSYPTRRKQFHSPQVAERHSPSMAHAEDHERVPDEEADFRQTIIQMRDMMKVIMEWTMMSQGEGSNPSMHKGGGGDKTPGRDGGNGASPPPSPPHHHLLLLLLQVRNIFPMGMVKLLRKFLH
jgi:hypothetical protein